MNSNLLSLLGLCRRGGMLEVGEEPVEAAARAKAAKVLLLASDAADNTARRVMHFAEAGSCLWLRVPFTKAQLGSITGRASCALMAVTDIGLASNIAGRLAQDDPAQYGVAAEKLALKAKRAAERKAEMLAHEKNIRQGRRRGKPAEPEETPPVPQQPQKRNAPAKRTGRPPAARPDDKRGGKPESRTGAGGQKRKPRPFKSKRPAARPANPYRHSHPVKKGKGSFRKKDES
jgi:ribosomal protein L7Ae-like RNA K-turn-binding protein